MCYFMARLVVTGDLGDNRFLTFVWYNLVWMSILVHYNSKAGNEYISNNTFVSVLRIDRSEEM